MEQGVKKSDSAPGVAQRLIHKRRPVLYPQALRQRWTVLLGLALLPGAALAELDIHALKLRYFGTAGLSHVASGNADFVRDLSQPDGPKGGQWSGTVDSLAGAQINLPLGSQFEVVGQAVSRHRYDDTYTPELTWAFLKYSPSPGVDLRGGRLGTDFFMRSDSRLVGYSYLTVRPSVDYYGGLPFQYLDGADAAVTWPLGEGLLRAKAFGGFSQEKVPFGSDPWVVDGSPMLGGNLDYQVGGWQFRANYAQIQYTHDLPGDFAGLMATLRGLPLPSAAAAADALTIRQSASRHYSAGVVYDEGPLQVQLMVSGAKHASAFFQDGVAGYFLAGYRVGDVTPYAGLSWSRTRGDTIASTGVPALDAAVSGAIGETHSDQHTYTLGLRWDFLPGMDLKAQWDAIRGSSDSRFLYRNEQPGWSGQTHVVTVALDFAF